MHGAPYKITFADGSVRKGTLDAQGQARVEGVKRGAAKIEIGEDAREWQIEEPDEQIANPAFGKKLTPEQLIELGKLYSSVNN